MLLSLLLQSPAVKADFKMRDFETFFISNLIHQLFEIIFNCAMQKIKSKLDVLQPALVIFSMALFFACHSVVIDIDTIGCVGIQGFTGRHISCICNLHICRHDAVFTDQLAIHRF